LTKNASCSKLKGNSFGILYTMCPLPVRIDNYKVHENTSFYASSLKYAF
jgi:hypothetical protein